MPRRLVDTVDAYQRAHRWLGFPLAVVYKFADDQGPYLAALITFYGFLSLFPLLLLLVTILGFVLDGDPDLQAKLIDSALVQFPVIGSQLRENVQSLKGSGIGLAVGILATRYGCLGAAAATQNAFNRAWAVPRNRRPNPVTARLRSLLLLPVLGAGVLVTTALAGPWRGRPIRSRPPSVAFHAGGGDADLAFMDRRTLTDPMIDRRGRQLSRSATTPSLEPYSRRSPAPMALSARSLSGWYSMRTILPSRNLYATVHSCSTGTPLTRPRPPVRMTITTQSPASMSSAPSEDAQ
jgi:Virulence factor BrkB